MSHEETDFTQSHTFQKALQNGEQIKKNVSTVLTQTKKELTRLQFIEDMTGESLNEPQRRMLKLMHMLEICDVVADDFMRSMHDASITN